MTNVPSDDAQATYSKWHNSSHIGRFHRTHLQGCGRTQHIIPFGGNEAIIGFVPY